jgi:hypothetical protein
MGRFPERMPVVASLPAWKYRSRSESTLMNSFLGTLGRVFSADEFVPRRARGPGPDRLFRGNSLVCCAMTSLTESDRHDEESL